MLAAALLLVSLPSASLGQSAGLVAAYAFDEGSGTSTADASGSGNTGAIGSATWTGQGRFGNALTFNGQNARVTVNDSASLDLTSAMTLEAWVFPTAGGGWRDVVYKATNAYYLMGSSDQGTPVAGVSSTGTLYGPSPLPLNTWTHLAATYEGTTMRLYVNGTQVASRPLAGGIAASSLPLTIGGDAVFGQPFAGRIDEVRVYNVPLNQDQIQADMASPVQGTPSDPNPPTVSLTSPGPGATVFHVASASAAASDDVGVTFVEFFMDGVSVGADFTPPYRVDWDTTSTPNGAHTLTAVARDAGGNQTVSTPVSLTMSNPAFVNETVVPNIADATTIAFLPGGRMLVGTLSEKIFVVQPGANQPDPTPFLQLDGSRLEDEQGLMDILPDSDFAANGWYYVFYTHTSVAGNATRVSRFTASGNTTLTGTEVVLWEDDAGAPGEHHGGSLAFGADGKLYITYGDGFAAETAQNLSSYRGKILRINLDGTIPSDNPFVDGPGPNRDEIWAYGLRNPFRMSVDPATGRMYFGDVGGNDATTAFEEINLGVRGANYGWPMCESTCGVPGTTNPIYSYPHNQRDAAVTGGFVYRGSQFPTEYVGSYFFGDYARNTIKRLRLDEDGTVTDVVDFWPASGALDLPGVGDPVKLTQGPDGSLYYVDIGFNGQYEPNPAAIRRIRFTLGNHPPTAVANATPLSGQAPLTVTFSSEGTSDPEGDPLTYSWTFGDGASSSTPNPVHTYAASGQYEATLTVSDGMNSAFDSVMIDVGTPPVGQVLAPADNALFRAGDHITITGDGTDAEDGSLPDSAFSWTVVFRHDGHIHPVAGPAVGDRDFALGIPTSGHDYAGNTRYEIILTVTDSDGLQDTSSVFIFPDKVDLTFATTPSGLTLQIDGVSRQTPFVLNDLKGFQHTMNAPDQSSAGTPYDFVSWSDGGAQSHGIVVPDSDTTYTATYEAADIEPPGAPGNPAATATSPTQVDLSWGAATDNVGVLQYRIERCQGAGCSTFVEIAATIGTSYADTGRSASTSYRYRVRAQDTSLNLGPYSTTATTQTPAPPARPLYFSLLSNGTVGGISAANEDVVLSDPVATFTLISDGSDVGLSSSRLDALAWLDADTLLLSLDADGAVLPGVAETVDDSDVIRFDASSLGGTTTGTFSMYFDGSDVGLTTSGEDVDAFDLLAGGSLLLSTEGSASVTGVTGDDKDLLSFTPSSLGSTTSGGFGLYFDASDVGLTASGEDVDAVAVDVAGRIYLSTLNGFSVTSIAGADEDVFVFNPSTLGTTTTGTFDSTLYFDGSAFALSANDLSAIDLPPGF
jgi:glucose/arabinose dehydrogenase/PKD repeat protein